MRARDKRIIEALAEFARPVILGYWDERSCIGSTRIGILTLQRFGIRARPVPVWVRAYNARYVELLAERGVAPDSDTWDGWFEEGAYSLAIGGQGEGSTTVKDGLHPNGEYDGHLVIGVGPQVMVDLSIDQAHRPQHGIPIYESLLGTFPRGWDKPPESTHHAMIGDAHITYTAVPQNNGFLLANDWKLVGRFKRVVAELEAAIKEKIG